MLARHLALVLALALPACSVAGVDSASRVPRASTLDDVPASTLRELDVGRMSGRWYVIVSNFEFWKKRRRSDPTLDYRVIPHDDVVKLRDLVLFRQGGRAQKYVGVDIQDPELAGHFQWQGDGALFGIKNQWFVVRVDPAYHWAVIYFSKSNFGTGAGLEIVAREPALDAATLRAILDDVYATPDLARRAGGLFALTHGDHPGPAIQLGPR